MLTSLTPYSAVRTTFGLVLLTLWTFTSRGTESDVALVGTFPLLGYGTFQLFEGVARYQREPTLPSLTWLRREAMALAFTIMMTVVMFLSEAEADEKMPPGGLAAGMIVSAALTHFMVAKRDARIANQVVSVRLGVAFVVGVALAVVAANAAHLTIIDTMGLPAIAASAAMLTTPLAWRAWEKRLIYEATPTLVDADLRERVEAAEQGDGDELLLRLQESGDVTHIFVRHGDESELHVPVGALPTMKEGPFILVRGARIVTATRGGDGYRGTDEYERLEGTDLITSVGELPLPEPRKRPVPPLVVEAALLIVVVLLTGIAFVAGEWALARPRA